MPVQTSYNGGPSRAVAGMIAEGGARVRSRVAEAATVAGQLAIRGTADGQARALASGDAPSADTDAIMTVQATATTAQVCTGATLDGVVGTTVFWPPRNVTLTLNSHADWDPSTILVEGLDAFGAPCAEAFEVPNGGNVTLTGVVAFSRVVNVKIPPQTGTNGTLDVGLGLAIGAIDRKVEGIAVYDATREPEAYGQYDDMPVLDQGFVWVTSEAAATKGDPVYVRFVVTGGEAYGAIRPTPDANDCGLLRAARYAETITGAGLAKIELNLP